MSAYRLWVNAESTLLVRQWMKTGDVEIAERDDPNFTGEQWAEFQALIGPRSGR